MNNTAILVVIVNYRTPEMVLHCLASLDQERRIFPGLKVAVIDNDSGDGSVETMALGVKKNGWSTWARIAPSLRNVGFGAGNNVLLREDLASENPADYYLILNPDTEVCPGFFAHQLSFFAEHPKASILGPRTESAPGEVEISAFRFPGLASDIRGGLRFGFVDRWLAKKIVAPPVQNEAHQSDWISGGCMFVRRNVLETAGLFDETFFLYFEEIDLCRRAAQHGFQSWYVPEAKIMHWAGASTGINSDDGPSKRMPGWWFASRRHYLKNFNGPLYVLACDLAYASGRCLWQLRAWVTRRKATDPPHFLWDFVRFNLLGQRWDRT